MAKIKSVKNFESTRTGTSNMLPEPQIDDDIRSRRSDAGGETGMDGVDFQQPI